MTDAVVYIPEDLEGDDGLCARQGVAHAERRGYRLAGVVRVWKHVLTLAAEGTVVIFTRPEHAARHARYRSIKREFVGEETCGLIPFFANGELVGRSAHSVVNEVTAYRHGYADGFVDSTTLRSAQQRQSHRR